MAFLRRTLVAIIDRSTKITNGEIKNGRIGVNILEKNLGKSCECMEEFLEDWVKESLEEFLE